MEYEVDIQYNMTEGLCYYLSGHLQDVGGGDSVDFEIGNGTTFDTLGTISADGGFNFFWTYTASPEYTVLKITITGTVTLTKLAIRIQEQCIPKVCSECFTVNNCEPPHREHLLLAWYNNEDGFGFQYSGVDFIQTLYVVGGIRNPDYSYDEELFINSSQERFPVYVAATKTKELWIHEIPEYLHDAIRLGIAHDYFSINGEKWVKLEGSYSPDNDTPNSLLAPVIVKIAKFDQNTVNDNCSN